MAKFGSFTGVVTAINNFSTGAGAPSGCYKLMSVQSASGGTINFVIAPNTYFVGHVMVNVRDQVTGFFDTTVPAPMIYPPQYQAVVMTKDLPNQKVKVDYFDRQLVSSDGTFKIVMGPFTQVIQENGQRFTMNPGDRDLAVVYGSATMGVPAQTVPYWVIVLCNRT